MRTYQGSNRNRGRDKEVARLGEAAARAPAHRWGFWKAYPMPAWEGRWSYRVGPQRQRQQGKEGGARAHASWASGWARPKTERSAKLGQKAE
jgi:hypothetical protein